MHWNRFNIFACCGGFRYGHGIRPDVFTEKDFAASFTSSINLPFPASFFVAPDQLTSPNDDRPNEENERSDHLRTNLVVRCTSTLLLLIYLMYMSLLLCQI
jgi:hypothetical protein